MEQLPDELLKHEICEKYLSITDTVQLGRALNRTSDPFFKPEKIYLLEDWKSAGYPEEFYHVLVFCCKFKLRLNEFFKRNSYVIELAYETVALVKDRNDVETLAFLLDEPFLVNKFITMDFAVLEKNLPGMNI